jgi:hypothetical protein
VDFFSAIGCSSEFVTAALNANENLSTAHTVRAENSDGFVMNCARTEVQDLEEQR